MMHDLVIIGGGPAGLSAAAYALSKHLDVVVLSSKMGGKVGQRQWLANQKEREVLAGEQAFLALYNEVNAHQAFLVDDYVVAITEQDDALLVTTERGAFETTTVLIATGTQPTKLGIAREEELVGRGLAYSATTHAHLLAGRDVAVIGATGRALRSAAELIQFAHNVLIVAPQHEQLDSQLGQQLRAHPRVKILEGYTVSALDAPEGLVRAIQITRGGMTHRVPIDAVFVELGLVPNTHMVRSLVTLDKKGFILTDVGHQTSCAGV
ncbi:MAG TPA: FAD-dependent oxidoreductase, partial [Roseiflexaceae bacterium]|nr:FAD-dependent oxidoreductase [Roseiflexaceae bacterium]